MRMSRSTRRARNEGALFEEFDTWKKREPVAVVRKRSLSKNFTQSRSGSGRASIIEDVSDVMRHTIENGGARISRERDEPRSDIEKRIENNRRRLSVDTSTGTPTRCKLNRRLITRSERGYSGESLAKDAVIRRCKGITTHTKKVNG